MRRRGGVGEREWRGGGGGREEEQWVWEVGEDGGVGGVGGVEDYSVFIRDVFFLSSL